MPFRGVRAAAVAGSFYPADPGVLRRDVSVFLDEGRRLAGSRPAARAVIAPHAGYVYSGAIAGSAFARLSEVAEGLDRIVLLGPAHRVRVWGLALPSAEAFATPLGEMPLDREAAQSILGLPQVGVDGEAHRLEHSLEVELPFLQALIPGLPVLPLVVGRASADEVAEVLELIWDERTVVVVSSDLSHFLSYDEALRRDRSTAERIARLSTSLGPEEACGAAPINGLLLVARRRRLQVERLDLRNSGDTAGDRSRVVGYGAFALH